MIKLCAFVVELQADSFAQPIRKWHSLYPGEGARSKGPRYFWRENHLSFDG